MHSLLLYLRDVEDSFRPSLPSVIGLSVLYFPTRGSPRYKENNIWISRELNSQPPMNPKTHRRYVDDSHTRFDTMNQASRFLVELNSQDERVQYTMEIEAEDKSLAILQFRTKNTGEGRYEFKIHRKKAITNVFLSKMS